MNKLLGIGLLGAGGWWLGNQMGWFGAPATPAAGATTDPAAAAAAAKVIADAAAAKAAASGDAASKAAADAAAKLAADAKAAADVAAKATSDSKAAADLAAAIKGCNTQGGTWNPTANACHMTDVLTTLVLRQKVLADGGGGIHGGGSAPHTADEWNFWWGKESGVPQTTDLFPPGNRGAGLTFDDYMAARSAAGLTGYRPRFQNYVRKSRVA